MKSHTVIAALMCIGGLSGCAEPGVWSSVAPGYENGIVLSRVYIDVNDMPEPARSWAENELARGLAGLGVIPLRPALKRPSGGARSTLHGRAADTPPDAVLHMDLVSQTYSTVDVPLTFHPGETTITTTEEHGKTVTEIEETAGYYTGGYSYEVPVSRAKLSLTRTTPDDAGTATGDTIWLANTQVGERGASWANLAAEMARRAMRQLGYDKVIVTPDDSVQRVAGR